MSKKAASKRGKEKVVRYESPSSSDPYDSYDSYTSYSSDYSQRARRRGKDRGDRRDRRDRRRESPSETSGDEPEAYHDELSVVKGLPYLVDNSIIRAPTDGLTFRRSPNMGDRDGVACAKWGVIVYGVPIGTDWLAVGDRYLPMKINGTQILVPQVGAIPTGKAMTTHDFKKEESQKKKEDKKLLDMKIQEAQVIAKKHATEAEKRRELLELDRAKKEEAAIMIQRNWRRYEAQRNYQEILQEKKEQETRALKREKAEKARQRQKQLDAEERQRQEEAAIKIQSRARVILARKEYQKKVLEKAEREARQKAQEELERKRKEVADMKAFQLKREDAATRIQARFRGKLARKRYLEEKENQARQAKREELALKRAQEKTEAAAATKIQATFRGKKARQETKLILSAREEEARRKEEEKEKRRVEAEKKRLEELAKQEREKMKQREKAALKIQRWFRGWRARKDFFFKLRRIKERTLTEKRLKAMKAQEISGRPMRFVAPHEGARPWDRWQSKPNSKANVSKLRYNPRYGPPKDWNFATGAGSIEEEVSAAERAISERLTWAGSKRRLARPARYMTEEALNTAVTGDPFDFSGPGALRASALDHGHSRAAGTVGATPPRPDLDRKKMQQKLKRMEDKQQEIMRADAENLMRRKENAAVKIQSRWRAKKASRRVGDMKENRRRAQLDEQRRMERQREREAAQRKVQAMESKRRRELQRSDHLTRGQQQREQEMAAVKIQTMYRGRLARRQVTDVKQTRIQRQREDADERAKREMRQYMEQRLENLDLPVFRMAAMGFVSTAELNGAGSCPPPSNGPLGDTRSKQSRQNYPMGTPAGRGPSTPAAGFSPSRRGASGPMTGAGRNGAASSGPVMGSPGPGRRAPGLGEHREGGPGGRTPAGDLGVAEGGAGALPPPEFAGKTPPRPYRESVTMTLSGAGAARAPGSQYQGAASAAGAPPPASSLAMRHRDLRVR